MGGQPWLAASLAVIMLVTAVYCLTRLGLSWRRGRGTDRQVDALHVLMGVAMAWMLWPRLRLPWPGGWEVAFGATAAMLAWRLGRGRRRRGSDGHQPGHDVAHLLGCAAMLYMLAAGGAIAVRAASGRTTSAGMTGAAGQSATLALALAVALLASVVLTADRMTSLPRLAAPGPATTLHAATLHAATMRAATMRAGKLRAATLHAATGTAFTTGARPPRLTVMSRQAAPPAPRRDAPLSPRLAACCEIAMGLTMGYMLVTML